MMNSEDLVSRLYYVAHIVTSVIMAVTIEHPDEPFFSYKRQAFFHALASIMCRCVTLFSELFSSF